MKKKKTATNWRKRAESANEAWLSCARLLAKVRVECEVNQKRAEEAQQETRRVRDFWSEHASYNQRESEKTIADLRGQIEVGDALLDKQRERLIRLTEMKNKAQSFINVFRTVGMDLYVTCELDGTQWTKVYNITNAVLALAPLERSIAALEVDTAIPQKEKP